jgi:photosystem II stability/assembly factor-like uncharacterized protein
MRHPVPRIITLSACLLFAVAPGRAQWEETKVPEANNFFAFAARGKTLFAATSGGIYRSRDTGKTWVDVSDRLTVASCLSLAVLGDNVFAAMAGGQVYRSRDDGDSWVHVDADTGLGAMPVLAASGNRLFAGSWTFGVYRSLDSGESWPKVYSGPSEMGLKAFAADDSLLFAGTTADAGHAGGVFRSRDNGESWTATGFTQGISSQFALAMSGGTLYVGKWGAAGGVYRSRDKGDSWMKVDNWTGERYVNAVFATGTYLFAGTEYGHVYCSRDEGETWTPIDNGLMKTRVFSFTVFDSTLFVGLDEAVWKRRLSDIPVAVRPSGRPRTSGFAQGSLFRSGGRIAFRLRDRAAMESGLYDVSGRDVTSPKPPASKRKGTSR